MEQKAEQNIVYEEKTFEDGKIHVQASCKHCGGFLKWWPKVTDEEFEMPFGKYKGKKLTDIIKDDRDYAVWAAANLTKGNVAKRIQNLLKS